MTKAIKNYLAGMTLWTELTKAEKTWLLVNNLRACPAGMALWTELTKAEKTRLLVNDLRACPAAATDFRAS